MNTSQSTPNSLGLSHPRTHALHSRSSVVVNKCQICDSADLTSVLFLGFLPPVNTMRPISSRAGEETAYPAELLSCRRCHLAQLGLIVDASILFPPTYPYTSGTTKVLRENFAELSQEVSQVVKLDSKSLVVDIGSNDGTLLSNFLSHNVQGVTPENIGQLAIKKGIPTITSFFNQSVADQIISNRGPAHLVTATNVFAHMENIHDVIDAIKSLMDKDKGCFVSESHYLLPLLETVQYDTIYHEHLRYYSLTSLVYLLKSHGLEVFHAKRIPTHGGSIRVYAARPGCYSVRSSVAEILKEESSLLSSDRSFSEFKNRVVRSKLDLLGLVGTIKSKGQKIYGLGAPSRASTLINYVGLDHDLVDCVLEVSGSHKVGKYMPGTLIPVLDEAKLYEDQPDYALMLSWHIAEEIAHKLRSKGFKGKFLVPLPEARILDI